MTTVITQKIILAGVFLLGLIAALSATAQAGRSSLFVAVDPFYGDNETGVFLEHRFARWQAHAGCFNPCAVGAEYVWPTDRRFDFFLGLAVLDGVNHVNGTKLNISGGLALRISKQFSVQWRHYSNGSRWNSPIGDDNAPNQGWNFLGASFDFR